jgi:hypothetical protein
MSFRVPPVDPVYQVQAISAAQEGQQTLTFEARVLAARPSRAARGQKPGSDRRRGAVAADPAGSRVIVLLVPNGTQLPADVQKPGHRVFLRFAKPG